MDYTEETFDKVIDLNVKGVFNTTRVAAECMVARGKGVILSTSSMVSISGQPKVTVRSSVQNLCRSQERRSNGFTRLPERK